MRHGNRWVQARISSIDSVLDIHSLAAQDAHELPVNAIGKVTMEVQHELPVEPFASNRVGGALIVVDPPATAPAARCSWTPSRRRPRKTGKAWHERGQGLFVSAGPGSADLITVRGAARWLRPRSCSTTPWPTPSCAATRRMRAGSMSAKRGFEHSAKQARSTPLLVETARQHRAWWCGSPGGDASVFGRLEEELIALAEAGLDCEVVPGVTAAPPPPRRPSARSRGVGVAARSACPRP